MTCYDPHGNNVTGSGEFQWQPCTDIHFKSDDGYAPCCQITNGYSCLENLMCQKFQAAPYSTLNTRGGCTDPTFQSPNCPQFCLAGDMQNGGNFVTDCGNGTGCCNIGSWNNACSCQPGVQNALDLGIDTIGPLVSSIVPTSSIIQTVTVSPTLATSSTSSSTSTPTPSSISRSTPSSTSSSTSSTMSSSTSLSASPSIASPTSLSTSSSSSIQNPTSTAGSSPAVNSNTSSAGNSSDLGLKVGLPIGLAGLVLLAALIYLVYRRKSHQKAGSYQDNRTGAEKDYHINREPGIAAD